MYLTLSPLSYQILWLLWGTPWILRKDSFLDQCCYRVFVTCYIKISHTKFRPKSNKIKQDFRIMKLYEIEILYHFDFELRGFIFLLGDHPRY